VQTEADRWRERTEQKLRFAELHLDEVLATDLPGHGHDFERSHLEAVLYQLVGASDTFKRELLALAGRRSPLVDRLAAFRNNKTEGLGELVALRDSSTHSSGVPLSFYMGSENDGKVAFKHPDTLVEFPERATDTLAGWLRTMRALFSELREAACAPAE